MVHVLDVADHPTGKIGTWLAANNDGQDILLTGGQWPTVHIYSYNAEGEKLDLKGATITFDQGTTCYTLYLRLMKNFQIEGVRQAGQEGVEPVGGKSQKWMDIILCDDFTMTDFTSKGILWTGYSTGQSYVENYPWGISMSVQNCNRFTIEQGILQRSSIGLTIDGCDDGLVQICESGSPLASEWRNNMVATDPIRLDGGCKRVWIDQWKHWPGIRDPERSVENGDDITVPPYRGQTEHPDLTHFLSDNEADWVGCEDITLSRILCCDIDQDPNVWAMSGIRVQSRQIDPVADFQRRIHIRDCTISTFEQPVVVNGNSESMIVEDTALLTDIAEEAGAQVILSYLGPQLAYDTNIVRRMVAAGEPEHVQEDYPLWEDADVQLDPSIIKDDPNDARTWRIDPASKAYNTGYLDIRDSFGDWGGDVTPPEPPSAGTIAATIARWLPAGGDDGFVLSKASGADFAFEWSEREIVYPAPLVTSTIPASGATNVSPAATITVEFDQDVAFATGNITLRDITNSMDVETIDVTAPGAAATIFDSTLIVTPSAEMDYSVEHGLLIDAGAIESDPHAVAFAGLAQGDLSFTVTSAAAVLLTSTDPIDGATNVPPASTFALTFDQDVAFSTGNIVVYDVSGDTALETIDVTSPGGAATIAGPVLTITPSADLPFEAAVEVRIDATAIEAAATGGPFAGLAAGDYGVSVAAEPAADPTFDDALTDTANNSIDMRFTTTLATVGSYEWMDSEEQAIDTNFIADQAQKDRLRAAGTYVFTADIREAVEGNGVTCINNVRTFTDPTFYETGAFRFSDNTWTSVGEEFDYHNDADVSALYGEAAGTVRRIWLVYTLTVDEASRIFMTGNDLVSATRMRRMGIFDRTVFNADDATMDTQLAAMVP